MNTVPQLSDDEFVAIKFLQNPTVEIPLPKNFDLKEEAQHLEYLWRKTKKLQRYTFKNFVHAGGSGMVFEVEQMSKGEDRFGYNENWNLDYVKKKCKELIETYYYKDYENFKNGN